MAEATKSTREVTKTVTVQEDVITLVLSPNEAQNLRSFLGAALADADFDHLHAVYDALTPHTGFNIDLVNKMVTYLRAYN